ncbi:MAG: flagellar type III secretion system pore protein FliP [Gemmatimonadetes bacterium]|nr:flagellar type III secretion system pore protein FliP [Gemmatimonadota bacterium]
MIAVVSIVAALAFVLGLGALCLWALKRWGAGSMGARSRVPVEIVQRLPLGPKTGLAVVRVGEKVMALSVGDGGVRPLFELDEADRQRVLATSAVPVSMTSSPEAAAAIAALAPPPGAPAAAQQLGARFGSLLGKALRGQPLVEMPAATPAMPMTAMATMAPATPAPISSFAPPAMTAVAPFRFDERTEVPRFLTAPLTTSRGAPATYAPTFATAMRLTALAAMLFVGGAPVLRAQAAGAQAPVTQAVQQAVTQAAQQLAPQSAQPAAQQPAATPSANGKLVLRPAPLPQGKARSAPTAPTAPTADGDALSKVLPKMDVQLGEGEGGLRLNGTVGIVVMMGLLTLLPMLLLMMTGFTRILIVLHFLKQAMGTQSAPPAQLLAAMALLLTGFVMGPTLAEANRTAITPWLDGQIEQVDMLKEGVKPFRAFMLKQTRESDLKTFVELSKLPRPATVDDVPLHVLMSAFVASELRTAFQIGFAIYLPFIIIDAVVASVLMSMGMFMLPPAMISLPFKLLLFVLVDGWSLTISSLVQSFK